MKQLIALVLCACMIGAACPAMAHEPWILVYASNAETGSVVELTASAFNGAVINGTDDNIELDVHLGGELGDAKAVLESVTSNRGEIDFTSMPNDTLMDMGCLQLTVLSAPFLFRGDEHLKSFFKTKLVQEIQSEPQNRKLGVYGVSLLDAGFYGYALRRDAAGLDNLKIAVPKERFAAEIAEAMGAETVTLPVEQALAALRAGEVDGVEVTLEQYEAYGLSQDAPYYLMDQHRVRFHMLVMSGDTWYRALNREQKQLLEAGQYAMDFCTNQRTRRDTKYLESMVVSGVKVIEADREALIARCAAVIELARKDNEGLYQKIEAVR